MLINGINWQTPEPTSYSMEYWYDRKQKYWVIQVFDNFDCQVDGDNCPNQAWKKQSMEWLIKKYKITNIKKV